MIDGVTVPTLAIDLTYQISSARMVDYDQLIFYTVFRARNNMKTAQV